MTACGSVRHGGIIPELLLAVVVVVVGEGGFEVEWFASTLSA
jgi:hypothetical protein